jgi:hypothetical protein
MRRRPKKIRFETLRTKLRAVAGAVLPVEDLLFDLSPDTLVDNLLEYN